MTHDEYQQLKANIEAKKIKAKKIVVADDPPPTQHRGGGKSKSDKLSTRAALHQMAIFFELDEKKSEWFIRQLELSQKI